MGGGGFVDETRRHMMGVGRMEDLSKKAQKNRSLAGCHMARVHCRSIPASESDEAAVGRHADQRVRRESCG